MARQYRAADVAAYTIAAAIELGKPVSNLQLQKILFFCQCTNLQHNGDVLFSDDIVAWQYGPVVRSVYNTYSYRGASPIRRAAKYVSGGLFDKLVPIAELDASARRLANDVLEQWIHEPAWNLVRKTHEPGGAWDKVYNEGGIEGSGYGNVIPVSLMRLERLA